jgi:hypothetical protein
MTTTAPEYGSEQHIFNILVCAGSRDFDGLSTNELRMVAPIAVERGLAEQAFAIGYELGKRP